MQLFFHFHADTGEISKEHTGLELTCLIIHNIDREPDAWALVVFTIPLIKSNQVSLLKLVLELSSKVNHKSILGPGLNGPSVGVRAVREVKSLHGSGILDELMHETQVVITTCVDVFTDLLSDRRVIKPIGVHGKRTEGQDDEGDHDDHHQAYTACDALT